LGPVKRRRNWSQTSDKDFNPRKTPNKNLKNPMNPMIQPKRTVKSGITGTLLILLTFVWFAPSPQAFGVVPPPDGGYANFTTAEGTKALLHLTSGVANTGLGWSSLLNVTTGSFNTGVGAGALALNTADSNTATGTAALLLNTIGTENTANGTAALLNNSNGISNSAFGAFALNSNVGGNSNTAVGDSALFLNNTGDFNTAMGSFALGSNTTGSDNTAVGAGALENNTGSENTAIGSQALLFNTAGNHNTATGFQALQANSADDNTALGHQALFFNTTGSGNTAMGLQALLNSNDGNLNTAIGWNALLQNTSGSDNIALGADAGLNLTTGDHNIVIGDSGVAGESGTIRIGNNIHTTRAFIAGIHGVITSGGTAVYINPSGQLGTATSSARFKEDIHSMDKASEAVLALRPVTFRYHKKIDPAGISQFGLVAEDVEKVNPDLIVRDNEGKPYSVRYEQVNAMLLNEFLKEHQKVDAQQKQIDTLITQLKQQEARIQRISDQIETTKATAQLAKTGW
jgi:Chaperone of endosialidase